MFLQELITSLNKQSMRVKVKQIVVVWNSDYQVNVVNDCPDMITPESLTKYIRFKQDIFDLRPATPLKK